MTAFTVMTWNVENLFPPGFQISPAHQVAQQEYDDKLAFLSGIIHAAQPTVFAAQEIGGAGAADQTVFDNLGDLLQDILPERRVSSRPDGRGIRVALYSALPILSSDEIIDFAPGKLDHVPDFDPSPDLTKLSRGALAIEVEPVNGLRVRIVTTHLKSKLISYPPLHPGGPTRFNPKNENERAEGAGLALLRRTAEVVAIRDNLNAVMAQAGAPQVVLLGDLNDEPKAATTQLLLGPADKDVTSPDGGDKFRLYDLCDEIPLPGTATKIFLSPNDPSQRFSRIFEGRGELIDHIMVSRGLLGTPAQNAVDQWAVTEVRSLTNIITGESVDTDPGGRVGAVRPDHAPVLARFEL